MKMRTFFAIFLALALLGCGRSGPGAGDSPAAERALRDQNLNAQVRAILGPSARRAAKRARRTDANRMPLEVMFPEPRTRTLAAAAGTGNLLKIDKITAAGVDVNAIGKQAIPVLYWALRHNFSGYQRLLQLGADPNLIFRFGGAGFHTTVLHAAAAKKDLRYFEAALKHGGNIHSVDDFDGPLLHAVKRNLSAMKLLLARGVDIDTKQKHGFTVLMRAIAGRDYEIALALLKLGANFRIVANNGWTIEKNLSFQQTMNRNTLIFSGRLEPVIDWLQAHGMKFHRRTKLWD